MKPFTKLPSKLPVLISILIFPILSPAQKRIQLSADYAIFRYDSRANFVEVYYSVRNAPESVMKLSVMRNDTVWTESSWKNGKNDSLRKEDAIIGRAYFVAPEGKYNWKLIAQNAQTADSVLFEKAIQPFPSDRLGLSDIELASTIQFGTDRSSGNPFYKNSLIVVPNPAMQYGLKQPLLYFYVELYNVLDGIQGEEYHTRISVLDENRKDVEKVKPIVRKKNKSNESVVDFGELGLFGIGSGKYVFSFSIQDAQGTVLIEKTKPFWVYSPTEEVKAVNPADLDKEFNESPFSVMDEMTLGYEYETTRFLMTDQQKKMYSALKILNAKRRFLFEFWRTVGTGTNPAQPISYDAFKKRIEEANLLYGTMQMQGWKTDRGRIFLTYGKPNDVERFPSTSGMVPYEIWDYDAIEGGVVFVFADLSGFKNYSLLHSTKRGEVYNPEYERQLKSGF